MSAVAVGMGVAAVAGAVVSANASENAASTEANAANNASGVQQNQYNLNRADMQPWLDSGKNALGQLNQQMPNLTRGFSMADFQADPGYAFNLQQGQQAIERSAAARGGLDSGATMKSLAGYSQGLAGQQYDAAFNRYNTTQGNTFNRLATMAGMGQQAATTNAANGTATANSIGNNMMGAGNAQAAGQIAQGNNITSLVGSGMNTWLGNQYLNKYGNAGNGSGGTGSPSTYTNPAAGWNPEGLSMPVPQY